MCFQQVEDENLRDDESLESWPSKISQLPNSILLEDKHHES